MELKNTKARKHILGVLKTVKTPLTAEEVYIKVKDFKINMSTVYRSLNTFTKSNLVKKEISNIDKKAYYSLLSTEHYHILECTTCHKKISNRQRKRFIINLALKSMMRTL